LLNFVLTGDSSIEDKFKMLETLAILKEQECLSLSSIYQRVRQGLSEKTAWNTLSHISYLKMASDLGVENPYNLSSECLEGTEDQVKKAMSENIDSYI